MPPDLPKEPRSPRKTQINELDDVGLLLGDNLGQAAGGDDFHLGAQLLAETGHHALYQAHVAK